MAHLRERYDPAARRGLGAHITIMYPLLPPERLDEAVLRRIADIAAGVECFRYKLTHVARFPATIYLAPKPASRFADLHERFRSVFADADSGSHAAYVPHLSVARNLTGDDHGVDAELKALLARSGPIDCACHALSLQENGSGLWRELRSFELPQGANT
ncbi:MAG: 2'-5' RNA ligase family protein [Proteobacteria bacterium]|nr:2'-5' RNA ligase family protein [Pseudomonadota bacterium]